MAIAIQRKKIDYAINKIIWKQNLWTYVLMTFKERDRVFGMHLVTWSENKSNTRICNTGGNPITSKISTCRNLIMRDRLLLGLEITSVFKCISSTRQNTKEIAETEWTNIRNQIQSQQLTNTSCQKMPQLLTMINIPTPFQPTSLSNTPKEDKIGKQWKEKENILQVITMTSIMKGGIIKEIICTKEIPMQEETLLTKFLQNKNITRLRWKENHHLRIDKSKSHKNKDLRENREEKEDLQVLEAQTHKILEKEKELPQLRVQSKTFSEGWGTTSSQTANFLTIWRTPKKIQRQNGYEISAIFDINF